MAQDRTIEPWSALLDEGLGDGRLVREAREGQGRAKLAEPPRELHPEVLAAYIEGVLQLDIRDEAPAASHASGLTPEEQAVQGLNVPQNVDEDRKEYADEDADTAALAEGRTDPPASTRDEPV